VSVTWRHASALGQKTKQRYAQLVCRILFGTVKVCLLAEHPTPFFGCARYHDLRCTYKADCPADHPAVLASQSQTSRRGSEPAPRRAMSSTSFSAEAPASAPARGGNSSAARDRVSAIKQLVAGRRSLSPPPSPDKTAALLAQFPVGCEQFWSAITDLYGYNRAKSLQVTATGTITQYLTCKSK